jgi:hypothetical protein
MARYRGQIILRGAGALSSLPVMFLAFLDQQLAGFTFIPYDLFDWLTRVLPGAFVGASVEFLVRLVSTLRTPPLREFSWVQWRANPPYLSGRHIFRVRATDGTGALQTSASSFPSGATGSFSYQVDL